jgi:hypothetical protein
MIEPMTSTFAGIHKRDVAIAALVSLVAIADSISLVVSDDFPASVLAVPMFLLITVPLAWRRAAPMGALAAMLGGLAIHVVLFGTAVVRCGIVIPTTFLLAFAIGSMLGRREAIAGLMLAEAGLVFMILTDGAEGIEDAIPLVTPVTAAIWGIGRVVHSRTQAVAALRERTSELRQARDERARLEVATDRARLSGELDELLQRRLGELAKLADAGSRAADPASAAVTLAAIELQGRQTLEHMRSLVGVLRDDGAEMETAPQPTLTQLEALLMRTKGVHARLSVEGSPRVLPPSVELSAYRVIEHLLEGLDDGPDVELRVRFTDDALELTITGPARQRSKAAIERARERVASQSGTLEATSRHGRAQAVVSLPLFAGA